MSQAPTKVYSFSILNHQVPGPNASHNGGGDQSDCHHLGNSSRGRGEPNKVLFSHQFLVPVHPGSWFLVPVHPLLCRGLTCIVDASDLSLSHMTFWNPIEVGRQKLFVQHCFFSWGVWSTFAKKAFLWDTRVSTTSTSHSLSTPCSTSSRASSA